MSDWWDDAPLADPLSPSAGRAAMEKSGDPRFAPATTANDSWWKMAPLARSEGDSFWRYATLVPQSLTQGLYDAGMFLPEASANVSKLTGLVPRDTPSPMQAFPFRRSVEPETTGERIVSDVGNAVGGVVASAVPGGMLAKIAAPGTRAAAIGETLAANPYLQAASTAAGNVAGDLTDNPWLGLGASLAVPTAAHGALRIPFAAPARTGAEVERRALLADAQNEGVPLSFGKIADSRPAQIFESVLQRLPFVGGQQESLDRAAKTAFNKAAFDKIPEVRGQGIDAATPGTMDQVGAQIGRKFDALQNSTTVNVDPQFGTDIAKAKAAFSQQLRAQMPGDIAAKLDELQSAADALKPKPAAPAPTPSLDKYPSTDVSVWLAPHQAVVPDNPTVTIDGQTYKNIRSKLSAQLGSTTGTDRQAIGAMIDALDGAVERSLPSDLVQDWKDARTSWRRFKMIEGATDSRHNAQTDLGYIPPGSLAARVGSDKEMERLAQIGTSFVGDKVPDSMTPTRMAYQNLLGLGAGGVGAMTYPVTTAALAGGGYLANLLMNNPYTRAALIARLNNAREGVLSKGLVATLAAQQQAHQQAGGP